MENFNSGWEFKLEGGTEWKPVKIPHDWLIADTRNLYKNSVGLYRKYYVLEEMPTDGQKFLLCFDGVYQDSRLYVNGQEAGEWKNGYTAFSHEITPFLTPGKNEIIMKVVYESPNTRWYSGAGIYRDCFLVRKNKIHFAENGIYVKNFKKDGNWHVEVEADAVTAGLECTFSYQVLSLDSQPVEKYETWDITNPVCYQLKSELRLKETNEVMDTAYTRFGFREIAYTPEGGFFLNGREVKLKGVCQHHDLGALGSAVHKDALRRQLLILKEMGVNAIRTAHNPPAAAFMELTDEMGFLVMTEFTDVWKRRKTTYDYARFFEEWAERDVASWVRRDRNCPSIIMWSIGNEIYDTHADAEDGKTTTKWLKEQVLRHAPNAHVTFSSNYLEWENTQASADILKLVGYNYAEKLYKPHKETYPDWIIYGGETAATVQSRGVYHFPLAKSLLADDDLQCSSLGNSSTSWGTKNTVAVIQDHREIMGQFLWTGFDYIGEPTPYHTKNSYFGQIDTAGFSKDAFYFFKSEWNDAPTLHLLPFWDWSPGQPVDVRIVSNAPKVELFLNGKSLGAQEIDIAANYILPYEPGHLKAVAYDENGNKLDEIERHSFGDATALKINETRIGELTFAEIYAVDKDGYPVENANNRVKITVKNGELLGLDNGDSTDYDQYQHTNNRRLFSGKLLAICNGSKPEITAEFDPSDIPIRKIELTRDSDNGLAITAKIFPINATYKDLQWRLSDANGIDSPLGRLSVSECGNTAILHPKGDGEVYVRCSANNGKDHISLISLLPITITGYGKPFLDPYSFISGGLYTHSNSTLTNGNERGIATARSGESHVGFSDLNFGTYCADEITMWLFPLMGNAAPIEIWLGLPETGRHLTTVTYDKGSIWNTYIPATYKLSERLTGIQTLSFIFRQKFHLKGFQFKSKTYDSIPFAAHDSIYGDSYKIAAPAVENIGNNVTITFNGMDFEKGAEKLELRWRSKLDKNTIRITFTNTHDKEITNTLTIPAAKDYTTAIFPLKNPLNGKGIISFIFLPGTDIDLEIFRFMER